MYRLILWKVLIDCCLTSTEQYFNYVYKLGARRGRDRMVVGFTATYAISTYHH